MIIKWLPLTVKLPLSSSCESPLLARVNVWLLEVSESIAESTPTTEVAETFYDMIDEVRPISVGASFMFVTLTVNAFAKS